MSPPVEQAPPWTAWRPPRRWVVIAIVLLAGFAVQCAVTSEPPEAPPPVTVQRDPGYSFQRSLISPSRSDVAEVRQVLDARADAVVKRDRGAFLASVDSTDDELVEQQGIVFDNLKQLELSTFRYLVSGQVVYPDHVLDENGYVVQLAQIYQLDGFDDGASMDVDAYTFVQRDGHWVIGSTTDADSDFNDYTYPLAWDGGAITAKRQGRFLVMADVGQGRAVKGLIAACGRGLDAASTRLDLPFDGSVVIDATSTDFGLPDFRTENAAAITFPVLAAVDPFESVPSWMIVGWHIRVDPSVLGTPFGDRVVVHELTHLVTQDYGTTSPAWLSEGIAEYVSWQGAGGIAGAYGEAGRVRPRREIPRTELFYESDQAAENYLLGYLLVEAIVDRLGVGGIQQTLDAYRSANVGRESRDAHTDQVLDEVTGVSADQLLDEAVALVAQAERRRPARAAR